MTPATPIELPTIDPRHARALNLLAGQGRRWRVELAGGGFGLRFTATAPRPVGPVASLTLAGQKGALWLSDWNALPAVAGLLEGVALGELPAPVRAALLSVALDATLDQLAASLGGPCDVLDVEDPGGPDAGDPWLGFELDPEGGAPLRGALRADSGALDPLLAWASMSAPERRNSLSALRLKPPVEVGVTRLTLDELRRVSPGDLVMLDVASPPGKRSGVVRFAPGLSWRVTLGDGAVTFEAPVDADRWGGMEPDGGSAVVVAGLGRLEVTPQEAVELVAGGTAPHVDPDALTLRIGPRPVGRGEAVCWGDRTAVRITEWRLRP